MKYCIPVISLLTLMLSSSAIIFFCHQGLTAGLNVACINYSSTFVGSPTDIFGVSGIGLRYGQSYERTFVYVIFVVCCTHLQWLEGNKRLVYAVNGICNHRARQLCGFVPYSAVPFSEKFLPP